MKKVAVIQSNYLPWKGYFDIINDVDLFVFYDDVQYSKGSWRNRNKIQTPYGVKWLSIPCGSSIHRLICEVNITDDSWQKSHWDRLKISYGDSRHFNDFKGIFQDMYLKTKWNNLSELNHYLIKLISRDILGIDTTFDDSRKYNLSGTSTDRLIHLLTEVGAEYYLTGPSAKSYIENDKFEKAGIELAYKDYSGYPEYDQLYQYFRHDVSIVDLLFNCGEESPFYIWGWRK